MATGRVCRASSSTVTRGIAPRRDSTSATHCNPTAAQNAGEGGDEPRSKSSESPSKPAATGQDGMNHSRSKSWRGSARRGSSPFAQHQMCLVSVVASAVISF